MRHPFVDEYLADVASGDTVGWVSVGEFGLLVPPLRAVGEQVVGVAGAHDSGAKRGPVQTRDVSMVIQRRPRCSAR